MTGTLSDNNLAAIRFIHAAGRSFTVSADSINPCFEKEDS